VKRFLYTLIFSAFSLYAGQNIPEQVNLRVVKEGLKQLKWVSQEDRKKILDHPDIVIDSPLLEDILNSCPEETRMQFLKTIFNLQDIDAIQSYARLLDNPTEQNCDEIAELANPHYAGVIPLADGLNALNFPSLYQPTMKNVLINREYFNEFNSLEEWGVWVEPFGGQTNFSQDSKPLNFSLYNLGVAIGGEYTFQERITFTLSLAYLYSEVDWKKFDDLTASTHAIYFGPALSYLFNHGYISFMTLGAVNFHNVDRKTTLFPLLISESKDSEITYHTWDLHARLEGGASTPLGGNFYLYPTFYLDYLYVFNQDVSEILDTDVNLHVEEANGSLFRTKVALKLNREVLKRDFAFIIPYVSVGWLNVIPLSESIYRYQVDGCEKSYKDDLSISSWSQYCFGVGLTVIHKRGILVKIGYENSGGN